MGGAIFNNGGSVTITNSTLSGNTATGGAAGTGTGSEFVLPGAGQGLGGAVFSRNGSLTVLNSTVLLNTANQGGRGIFNIWDAGSATVSLNNTTSDRATQRSATSRVKASTADRARRLASAT